MITEPLVSVICITYNHERYIRDCLESIVMQKTSFPYEVIIHDDCSTDGTAKIIKEFVEEYDNFKVIYQSENQYSQKKRIFNDICCPVTKGKYIAICEGDDYWTDETKLQQQYDAMESHPKQDMCACAAWEEMADTKIRLQSINPKNETGILTTSEVILGGGRYLATSTLFFRREIFSNLMPFHEIMQFDYTMQIRGALRGGIYFINNYMAIYRKATEGSWTQLVEADYEKRRLHREKEVSMLMQLDVDTEGRFHDAIVERLKAYTPFED